MRSAAYTAYAPQRTGDCCTVPQPASNAWASALQVARIVIGTISLVPSS
nr:MAG TPA: hypothetical protein [Caudoviricetes sp.]